LAQSLSSYTRKNHDCYDSEFDKQIRKLAPHWFVDKVLEKKKKLIEMAKRGHPRPHASNHPLGKAFNSYIGKTHSSYDPEFDKKIRKLAPNWFRKTRNV
jgi:hypothetical protein